MQEIKSIDIISWAKIHALFGIVVGLIYGICTAFVFGLFGIAEEMSGVVAFGVASIVIFPIILGILGFISGAIMAFLYNIFAAKIGGVQLELVQK
jgi:hypothetical protein